MAMRSIESGSTDPHFNLALEQYVFESLDRKFDYLMLWQNDKSIIIGKNQNTLAEINRKYVRDHKLSVVRRRSGGGAVYHDLGNINYTFITDAGEGAKIDFASFCMPVIMALQSLGVKAKLSGRNDMTIDGKKFSGNAQYIRQGRVMHHGTILFDSDLSAVGKALKVSPDKILSKGLKSVRSRVTNIRPHLPEDLTTSQFLEKLKDFFRKEYAPTPYHLTGEDLDAVNKIKEEVYDRYDWNFGQTPACQIEKTRRVEGCGQIQVHMDLKKGRIERIHFLGDYFGNADTGELSQMLTGLPLEEDALRERLLGIDLGQYFNQLDLDTFMRILIE